MSSNKVSKETSELLSLLSSRIETVKESIKESEQRTQSLKGEAEILLMAKDAVEKSVLQKPHSLSTNHTTTTTHAHSQQLKPLNSGDLSSGSPKKGGATPTKNINTSTNTSQAGGSGLQSTTAKSPSASRTLTPRGGSGVHHNTNSRPHHHKDPFLEGGSDGESSSSSEEDTYSTGAIDVSVDDLAKRGRSGSLPKTPPKASATPTTTTGGGLTGPHGGSGSSQASATVKPALVGSAIAGRQRDGCSNVTGKRRGDSSSEDDDSDLEDGSRPRVGTKKGFSASGKPVKPLAERSEEEVTKATEEMTAHLLSVLEKLKHETGTGEAGTPPAAEDFGLDDEYEEDVEAVRNLPS